MCGINGFTWGDHDLIPKMNAVTKNRGPDDEGEYVDNAVSLGHSRLSIIDLSQKGHQAVLASEDHRFPDHNGFDFTQINEALQDYAENKPLRGASTISMQVARNLFLWQGRSWIRKALEAYYTVLIELIWNKPRILETYLNVAEWGKGIFGADAAALHYFRCSSSAVSREQAALLAAVLPNPREWSPVRPSAFIRRRKAFILK